MQSSIDIILDTPLVRYKIAGTDVEPANLAGYVALFLAEPTTLREIKLNFKGKARFSDRTLANRAALKYTVFDHNWSFLQNGLCNKEHKLCAGHHKFPFRLSINESLPSSISSLAASISYYLCVRAIKPGFRSFHKLRATLEVPVLRSFRSEAMEYQNTLDVENSWPGKVAYAVMIPHKAWAAGDRLSALVKFSPLVKGVRLLSIEASISEKVKIVPRRCSPFAHPQQTVAKVLRNVVDGRAVLIDATAGQPFCLRNQPAPVTPALFTDSAPSFPLNNCVHRTFSAVSSCEMPNSAEDEDDSTSPLTSDLVTLMSIDIPATTTPSHQLRPVVVTHKLFLRVLISNPDGTRSELRCFFPLRILDHRLLDEARAFSAPARRVFYSATAFEGEVSEDVSSALDEDALLPSYPAHVRDVLANMYIPDSGFQETISPLCTSMEDVSSRPRGGQQRRHRYQNCGVVERTSWLDFIGSEQLLLSVPPFKAEARAADKPGNQNSRWRISWPLSLTTSQRRRYQEDNTSIYSARLGSCPHASSSTSRCTSPSFLEASIQRRQRRPGTSQSCASIDSSTSTSSSSSSSPSISFSCCSSCTKLLTSELLHRALTATPDYSSVAFGFVGVGGVLPLSSMEGLPSYEEALLTRAAQASL